MSKGYEDHKIDGTTVFQSRHVDLDDDNEEEDDGGGNEGPSFESSMRAKYPVQQSKPANPREFKNWGPIFNDRRKGR